MTKGALTLKDNVLSVWYAGVMMQKPVNQHLRI